MLTQTPYDLSPLIELIKNAPPEEIQALLNKDMSGKTALCQAMIQFRNDWAPKILTEPGMHYNYASLQHACKIFVDEWDNLYKASGNNYDKINLVWLLLIGFEMRRLPGIDRCMMAQRLCDVIKQNKDLLRSYTLNPLFAVGVFPITDNDDLLSGLGVDFSISIFSECTQSVNRSMCLASGMRSMMPTLFGSLCQTKTTNLQNLCNHSQPINRAGV